MSRAARSGRADAWRLPSERRSGKGRWTMPLLSLRVHCSGLNLWRAVAGADGDGQRVAAGLGDELRPLPDGCRKLPRVRRPSLRLRCGQRCRVSPRRTTPWSCVLNDLFGFDVSANALAEASIITECKAAVDGGLAGLKVGAVWSRCRTMGISGQQITAASRPHQIVVVRVGAGTFGKTCGG